MPKFECRKNTEYMLILEADNATDAKNKAFAVLDEEWDRSYSPITAEPVEEDEDG